MLISPTLYDSTWKKEMPLLFALFQLLLATANSDLHVWDATEAGIISKQMHDTYEPTRWWLQGLRNSSLDTGRTNGLVST